MMSDILIQWANSQLSENAYVSNLDEDFRDGYAFCNILLQNKRISSFNRFQRGINIHVVRENFKLIYSEFRKLNINFDARSAHDIMLGKSDAAASILSQLRAVLERYKHTTLVHNETPFIPNIRQKSHKPMYDDISLRHFDQTLRLLTKDFKCENIEKVLDRFKEKGRQHSRNIELHQIDDERKIVTHKNLLHMNVKNAEKNLRERHAASAKQGAFQLMLGKERSKSQLHAMRSFRCLQKSKKLDSHSKAILHDTKESSYEIEQFECSLYAPSASLETTDAQLEINIHHRDESKNLDRMAARRKRLIQQCQNRNRDFQCEIILRCHKDAHEVKSKAEIVICEAIKTVHRHKKVIMKNREYRNGQYENRKEQDLIEAVYFNKALCTAEIEAKSSQQAADLLRIQLAIEAAKRANACIIEKMCSELLNEVINLSLIAISYRDYDKSFVLKQTIMPKYSWQDLKRLFVNGYCHAYPCTLEIYKYESCNRTWILESNSQQDESSDITEKLNFLCKDDMEQYLNLSNTAVQDNLNSIVVLSPSDSILPCNMLGEAVINIRLSTENGSFLQSPTVDIFQFDYCICLLGQHKLDLAAKLAEQYNLKVISIDQELQQAVSAAQHTVLTEDILTNEINLGHMALDYILFGNEIPDSIYKNLVVEAIQRITEENKNKIASPWRGWIVDNFPKSEQLLELLDKYGANLDSENSTKSRMAKSSKITTPCINLSNKMASNSGVKIIFHLTKGKEFLFDSHNYQTSEHCMFQKNYNINIQNKASSEVLQNLIDEINRVAQVNSMNVDEKHQNLPESSDPSFISVTSKYDKIQNSDMARTLAEYWDKSEQVYMSTVKRVFHEQRLQRTQVSNHLSNVRKGFRQYLVRQDRKQIYFDEYIRKHNEMMYELRFEEEGMNELNLLLEECRNKLWLDMENRTSEAGCLLHSIESDEYLETQLSILTNGIIILMQAELDRFHSGINLMIDYHGVMFDSSLLNSLLQEEVPVEKSSKTQHTKALHGNHPKPSKSCVVASALRSAYPPEILSYCVKSSSSDSKKKTVTHKKGNSSVTSAALSNNIDYYTKYADIMSSAYDSAIQFSKSSNKDRYDDKVNELHLSALSNGIRYEASLFEKRLTGALSMGKDALNELVVKVKANFDMMKYEIQDKFNSDAEVVELVLRNASQAICSAMPIHKVFKFNRTLVNFDDTLSPAEIQKECPIIPESPSICSNLDINEKQMERFEKLLSKVCVDDRWVSADDLMEVFEVFRLAEKDMLPICWKDKSNECLIQILESTLDPENVGRLEKSGIINYFQCLR